MKVWLVFRKELMNALRDRRVLVSTVIVPLLVLPVVTIVPMTLMGQKERAARERPSRIAVTGLAYAELERALQASHRLRLVREDSVQKAVRLGQLDAGLEIVSRAQGLPSAQVNVLFNATRPESRAAADKIKLVIADLTRALVAREVDTTKVNLNPVLVVPTNVASAREMAGFFMGMLVGMMAVIGLISGGMVMAIDSTAGEKERRTLEVLLAAPISRNQIVLGKYLATLVMGMVSVALMTTGYGISMTVGLQALGGPDEFPIGSLVVAPQALLLILLVMLCVAGFIAALEMTISIFARSYREAQNYLTPLTIIAILPVIFIQTIPPSPPAALFYIPLMNAMLLIRELLMGSVVPVHVINTISSSLVFAVLSLRLAFAMFRRESAILR
jgi:sodium transport system permease protein